MARGRIALFPYAGGGPAAFAPLARAAADHLELYAYCPQGRDLRDDEAPATDWAALVADAAKGLAGLPPGPFVLYGHSLGAMLAADLAGTARGRDLKALIVGARACPNGDFTRYADLPDDDTALFEQLAEEYGPSPPGMTGEDVRAIAADRLRTDLRLLASRAAAPARQIDPPIIAVTGIADPSTPPDAVAPWAAMTRGGFRLERVPGGHYFVHSEARALSRLLAGAFDEAAR